MAGSAEWVAGSAVKLGIFSDFWRGASARAKNRKKCLKISAEFRPKIPPEIPPKIPPIRKLLRKLLVIRVNAIALSGMNVEKLSKF